MYTNDNGRNLSKSSCGENFSGKRYPINESRFIERCMDEVFDTPTNEDYDLAEAIARSINEAYYAGVEDGRGRAEVAR